MKILVGKIIGIVGLIGFGKSIIGKLLLRFYEVKIGKIIFDGIEIN